MRCRCADTIPRASKIKIRSPQDSTGLRRLRVNSNGAQGRNRTTDTVIFSHVLYQLSYLGAGPRWTARREERRGL
jgi:hypothetical protein